MEDLQVGDADVVVAAVLLDVDGVLAPHPGPLLPVQPAQDGRQLRLVSLREELAGQLGLQGCQLVTDFGLGGLISVSWVSRNNERNLRSDTRRRFCRTELL